MNQKQDNLITVLDAGSTKSCVLVAEVTVPVIEAELLEVSVKVTTLLPGCAVSKPDPLMVMVVALVGTFVAPPIVAYLAKRGAWDLALVFSAGMFFTASVCWLFINPRKVIVYSPADHAQLKAQGVLD